MDSFFSQWAHYACTLTTAIAVWSMILEAPVTDMELLTAATLAAAYTGLRQKERDGAI